MFTKKKTCSKMLSKLRSRKESDFDEFFCIWFPFQEVLLYKLDNTVSLFLVAILEYIAADILTLAGNFVMKIQHETISLDNLRIAMIADKVSSNITSSLKLTAGLLILNETIKKKLHIRLKYKRDLLRRCDSMKSHSTK